MSYRSSSISDANSILYTDEQTYTDSAEIDRLAMNFNLEFCENSGLMSSDFFDSILSMEDLGSDSETVESDGNNNSSESSVHKDIIWKRDGKQLEQKINHSSDSSHFEDESVSSESNNATHLCDEIVTLPSVDTSHTLNKTFKWISNQEELTTSMAQKMDKTELIRTSLYNNLETHSDIIREQKVQPVLTDSMNLKPNTKIMIQNPSNRKLIIKQVSSTTPLRKYNLSHEAKPQILHMQPLTDGSAVYLPFNAKSIRILDPPEVESESGLPSAHLEPQVKKRKVQKLTSFSLTDVKLNDDGKIVSCQEESQYPALNLTFEEKRLLTKEGIQLPTHYPLTKSEERELKRIRRKIRNKISAQDSRKRKKEYVDGLEERVKRGSEEKKILLQRIKQLEKQNSKLSQQLSKLQALLFKSTTSKASPSTCLLIVLLSALLVSLPNIHLPESNNMISEKEQTSVRRVLLSSPKATEEDTLSIDEFLIFNKEDEIEFESRFDGGIENGNITDKEIAMLIEKMEVKYGSGPDKNCSYKETLLKRLVNKVKDFLADSLIINTDYGGYRNLHGFFEPDIDDVSEINSSAVTSEDVSIISKGHCDATTALIAPHSVVISNAKEK